jgi:tetratricopeptide (TPR) repeat protein
MIRYRDARRFLDLRRNAMRIPFPDKLFTIPLHRNNPWLMGIVGLAVGILLTWIVTAIVFHQKERRLYEDSRVQFVDNADRLLAKHLTEDALTIYLDVLNVISEREDPGLYGHIKNNEGVCYYQLALSRDTEENLIKAIRAFDEALQIRTEEEYPLDYATTQNNLGTAYWKSSEVEEKEVNLMKAVMAFQEALKVRTFDAYPLDYAATQSNLGTV